MLLVFLYHRIGKKGTSLGVVEERFRSFRKTELPKKAIFLFKKATSISFDDGYFDFYHYIISRKLASVEGYGGTLGRMQKKIQKRNLCYISISFF